MPSGGFSCCDRPQSENKREYKERKYLDLARELKNKQTAEHEVDRDKNYSYHIRNNLTKTWKKQKTKKKTLK